jgi:hypothetical protein
MCTLERGKCHILFIEVWKTLREAFRTKLRLSNAIHLATYGQTERTIQTLKDLLRSCVFDFRGSWDDILPMMKYNYNKSFESSIKKTLNEALHGRKCQVSLCWDLMEMTILEGLDVIQDSINALNIVQ